MSRTAWLGVLLGVPAMFAQEPVVSRSKIWVETVQHGDLPVGVPRRRRPQRNRAVELRVPELEAKRIEAARLPRSIFSEPAFRAVWYESAPTSRTGWSRFWWTCRGVCPIRCGRGRR